MFDWTARTGSMAPLAVKAETADGMPPTSRYRWNRSVSLRWMKSGTSRRFAKLSRRMSNADPTSPFAQQNSSKSSGYMVNSSR